jgi:hypothetical protein
MIVEVKVPSDELEEEMDYRSFLVIFMDGKRFFDVSDGEPEDANLSRNFSGCYGIVNMMKSAYDAGKNGEEFTITQTEVQKGEDY